MPMPTCGLCGAGLQKGDKCPNCHPVVQATPVQPASPPPNLMEDANNQFAKMLGIDLGRNHDIANGGA